MVLELAAVVSDPLEWNSSLLGSYDGQTLTRQVSGELKGKQQTPCRESAQLPTSPHSTSGTRVFTKDHADQGKTASLRGRNRLSYVNMDVGSSQVSSDRLQLQGQPIQTATQDLISSRGPCSMVLSWTLIYPGFILHKNPTVPVFKDAEDVVEGSDLQASMKWQEKLQNRVLNTVLHMEEDKRTEEVGEGEGGRVGFSMLLERWWRMTVMLPSLGLSRRHWFEGVGMSH